MAGSPTVLLLLHTSLFFVFVCMPLVGAGHCLTWAPTAFGCHVSGAHMLLLSESGVWALACVACLGCTTCVRHVLVVLCGPNTSTVQRLPTCLPALANAGWLYESQAAFSSCPCRRQRLALWRCGAWHRRARQRTCIAACTLYVRNMCLCVHTSGFFGRDVACVTRLGRCWVSGRDCGAVRGYSRRVRHGEAVRAAVCKGLSGMRC